MAPADTIIRGGDGHDARFLRDMLRHAFHGRPADPDEGESILWRYVVAWGRPGDRAVIALDGPFPVGAAWYRLFTAEEAGHGFVVEDVPELAIAVVPSRRGKGIGAQLLRTLLAQARADGFAALSLSVQRDHPAVGLYERFGFRTLAERGGLRVMRVDLAAAAGSDPVTDA
jgi:ribosomal protein S18 acetylase RimI-like enzyme